ncbi:uncharacterized protein LOC123016062 isoform X2 [Tribolium madens]|uniref:uncharacterized protein LOC123016062 isoform X2 n=1 Tax=Tribolium madens TaxID=41895 RepID=UPI001CF7250B|nr:uncharacterized protein LOC123016062 isoform X2 [Tribolium madens]
MIDLCKTKTFSKSDYPCGASPNQIPSRDMTATRKTLQKFLLLLLFHSISTKFLDDICGHINGQRIFLEYGESGTLEANYSNNIFERFYKTKPERRCIVEFVSCPSCVIKITFNFMNLSTCGGDTCACDHVWIYQPTFEQSSEQFCRFTNSSMVYQSQTRRAIVVFLYSKKYEIAFSLDYVSERNKVVLTGNGTQMVQSPFFPNLYPSDLTMEYTIGCKTDNTCKINLVFTDFLIAPTSIIDFFDASGDRIYVTTGNIFRPPVITSGSSLVIRFYANGATGLGFKAYYSYISDVTNIDCGGQVGNPGGGITMMDMVQDGLKSFDCIWLVKPPETYHLKTHLYVKVVNFSGFVSAGSTELTVRQGLTSDGPVVENLKLSLPLFYTQKNREHIVEISQGFYIRFKGLFGPQSRLAIVYAAFNYNECLSGSDFLCHNKRCISSLLNCDGFDHCGDNSDEFALRCANDRRQGSQTPHFLFPKATLTTFATSTLAFLLCSFGLVGFIFAMVVLLYRISIKSRHQRQIQDHIETINAILEEGVVEIEEEIIIPDDPPDYEPPPDYDEVIKCFVPKKKR